MIKIGIAEFIFGLFLGSSVGVITMALIQINHDAKVAKAKEKDLE